MFIFSQSVCKHLHFLTVAYLKANHFLALLNINIDAFINIL